MSKPWTENHQREYARIMLQRLDLLAENTDLKTRLKVAESTVMHHQEMLHHIADWLSVIPHEIERAAMQKEIRDDIPKTKNLLSTYGVAEYLRRLNRGWNNDN
jgi:formate dehydrogenase maturation protein FdhE